MAEVVDNLRIGAAAGLGAQRGFRSTPGSFPHSSRCSAAVGGAVQLIDFVPRLQWNDLEVATA